MNRCVKRTRNMENVKAQLEGSSHCAASDVSGALDTDPEDYNQPHTKRMKTPPAQICPLFINHVLEQIFHGASLSDLKSFRLVCREWSRVATKCLQTRLDYITIGCRNVCHSHSLNYQNHAPSCQGLMSPSSSTSSSSSSAAISLSTAYCAISGSQTSSQFVSPKVNGDKLEKFLQVISTSTNPPFTKFEVVSSFFVPGNQLILHKFFQCSSPFIRVLKISLDNRALGDYSPQFLAHINFPKLSAMIFEVLRQFRLQPGGVEEIGEVEDPSLNENNVDTSTELRGNAVSYRILSSILIGATSLESLEVSLQRKCDGEGQGNVDGTPNFERDRMAGLGDGGTCPCQHFQVPLNNPEDGEPPNITTTSIISSPSAASSASSAVDCHLPLPITTGYQTTPPRISNSPKLKKLHLRLRNSFIHRNCVTSLLQRLANTLEELCFTEEGHGSRVIVDLPVMKRLSKLTISSICEFEQNFVTILPFSYTKQLPRLESLNLWDCFGTEERYEQFLLSVQTPSYSLQNLVLPSQFRNVRLAESIRTIFPRLKSLTMVFSTRTENLAVIESVFQCCGESLEELFLITDMDIQNQNVDHVLTGLPKEICRKMRVDENFVIPFYLKGMTRKASLLSLKRLRRLIFQLEHKYSRAPLITDVTGYLAFMEMPNLEYLRFTRYGMSWNCCEALAKKCRVDILTPNGNNVFGIDNFDFDFEGI